MAFPERKDNDDFTKPSRQNRGGRKQRDQYREERTRSEPYKRERFRYADADDEIDEDVNY